MREIGSNQNPVVKSLRALASSRERREQGRMLVEGETMIREALSCGLQPFDALVDGEKREKYADLVEKLQAAGANVYAAAARAIESASDTRTPQGVLASFELPEERELPTGRLVALDGVQDPGNVGTIWRTADAAGFSGLLLGENCADAHSQKVQRAAMGSAFRLPMRTGNLVEMLRSHQAKGYTVVASALNGAEYRKRSGLGRNVVLVIGNEARGISPEVLALADVRLKLPMLGGAESLNAAVAAGIFMYQLAVFEEEG